MILFNEIVRVDRRRTKPRTSTSASSLYPIDFRANHLLGSWNMSTSGFRCLVLEGTTQIPDTVEVDQHVDEMSTGSCSDDFHQLVITHLTHQPPTDRTLTIHNLRITTRHHTSHPHGCIGSDLQGPHRHQPTYGAL
jgi:hypothetical protein